MPNRPSTLTRPLAVMDGVNDLFARVLGGVQLPIYAEVCYPQALVEIRSELRTLQKSSRGRFDFQNLEVVHARRINYLQMAELHYSMAVLGYPAMMNLSPLGWTDASDLPRFGVLEIKPKSLFRARDPKASVFSMSVEVPYSSWEPKTVTFEPNIPDDMKNFYFPSATIMAQTCRETLGDGNRIFISSEFAGEMPLPLEAYIKQVLFKGHFDSVWAIFEATWKVGYSVLAQKDPVVVGLKKHKTLGNQYFFLGIFDPTKHEKAFADNYTFGPHFLRKN